MPRVWEFVFLMLIMKLPIAYLAWVVYWAIKAEPRPSEPVVRAAVAAPEPWAPRGPGRGRSRGGPHGSPARGYARSARATRASHR